MKTRHAMVGIVACAAGAAAYSAAVYGRLPERVPSHWNIHGQVDGWMSRDASAVMMPLMAIGLLALLFLLPHLSPKQFKVEPFRGTFNYVMLLCAGLFAYCHLVMLQAALHPSLGAGRPLIAGVFAFIGLIGNLMGKTRRNFWMGIRTPWTLASDAVWTSTHRFAGRLMVGAGLVGAVAVLAGAPVALCFWLLMAALVAPVVHSLVAYKRWERTQPE